MKQKIEVINDLLGYEGLKIIQRPDIFNFSLDSTLLADFVTVNKSDKKIIDLGCGNGYIPIFLTLKTKAQIDGVEIQPEIADLAKRSVSLNKLEHQITIYNNDLKDIYHTVGQSQYNVVTCNPPYFKFNGESKINESIHQTIARHEIYANLEDVIKSANILLKDGGTFAMVHRAERMMEILLKLDKHHFAVKRMRFVYPKTTSTDALAILVEAKKKGNSGSIKILPPMYVEKEDGTYTDEILKIFNYKKDDQLC